MIINSLHPKCNMASQFPSAPMKAIPLSNEHFYNLNK